MLTQNDTILVTGGSGYIAGWIIARLLERGYAVRATLRDLGRADAVRADIATITAAISGLEFVAADLLDDEGWDAAMHGVVAVMHVASPVMARRGVDTMTTAVEGTKRVMAAAARVGVERVVLTSSAAAANPKRPPSNPIDETVWTDVTAPGVSLYARSKTLAERAAWDFVQAHPEGPRLATILPGFVQGPLLGANASASLEVVRRMVRKQMSAVPRLGFAMVDVRDLADLHVTVLTDPRGMGERWMAAADFLWFGEVAAIVAERCGDGAPGKPARVMPDWLVRAAALFSAELRPLVPDLGKRRLFSSAKAGAVLGWQPRSARDAVIATVDSFARSATTR